MTKFQTILKSFRGILPYLTVALIIGVYLASGAVIGLFIGDSMIKYGYGHDVSYTTGFLTGLIIQLIRGVIVFFNQLNPTRILKSDWLGHSLAVFLCGGSVYEIFNLCPIPQLSFTFGFLMVMGCVAEMYLLKEVNYATNRELAMNKDSLKQVLLTRTKILKASTILNDIDQKEYQAQNANDEFTTAELMDELNKYEKTFSKN